MKQFFLFDRGLFLVIVISMMIPLTANADEKWHVLGNTGWVTGDSRLTLDMPSVSHPDLRVTSNAADDLQWIEINIPFTLGETIKGIYLCYKTPDEETYISQIRLAEYLIPGTATVHHDDSTDLMSTEGDCYLSSVNDYTPEGSVNLSLRLNFANPGDTIALGALGIYIDE